MGKNKRTLGQKIYEWIARKFASEQQNIEIIKKDVEIGAGIASAGMKATLLLTGNGALVPMITALAECGRAISAIRLTQASERVDSTIKDPDLCSEIKAELGELLSEASLERLEESKINLLVACHSCREVQKTLRVKAHAFIMETPVHKLTQLMYFLELLDGRHPTRIFARNYGSTIGRSVNESRFTTPAMALCEGEFGCWDWTVAELETQGIISRSNSGNYYWDEANYRKATTLQAEPCLHHDVNQFGTLLLSIFSKAAETPDINKRDAEATADHYGGDINAK